MANFTDIDAANAEIDRLIELVERGISDERFITWATATMVAQRLINNTLSLYAPSVRRSLNDNGHGPFDAMESQLRTISGAMAKMNKEQ